MRTAATCPLPTECISVPGNLEKGYTVPETPSQPAHIRIYRRDEVSTADWMAGLDDELPVSSISIPGTHDSATFTQPWPFISTQKMTILQQLNTGIRYFDLRCGLRDNVAEMVHGPSLLGISLYDVLGTMYSWLDAHPQEGLIVQIKEDRNAERSTVHFSQAIFSYISVQSERWRTANTTPLLGELRGKIQLFRRFSGPHFVAYGIDVTEWEDNPTTPFTINTRHCVQLTIQDHYKLADPKPLPGLIAVKGGDVSGLLDRACADQDANHWYLNFTSAYEFNFWYQLSPRQIAVGGYYGFSWEEGMNPRLKNFLVSRPGRQRFGIIILDFPELGTDDLILTLIKSNFEPKATFGNLALLLLVFIIVFIGLAMVCSDSVLAGPFSHVITLGKLTATYFDGS